MKLQKILHLSHTDIRADSRILKEMGALEVSEKFELMGVGVKLEEGASSSKKNLKAKIVSVLLFSKSLSFLPKPIRYGLNMAELTIRLVYYGLKFKPVAVHCHDTFALPAGVLLKMALGCRLIYDAHELESDKNGQTPALSKATLIIEKWAWKRIDLLISVSDSINDWYIDNLGLKPHLLILNSPEIAKDVDENADGDIGEKYFHSLYGIPLEKKVFIYIGILSEGRGIELCLQVFAPEAVNAHVVFMGYGPLKPKIDSFALKYSNIHLHKPIPHEQVVAIVKHADVGLCFVENVSLSDYYSLPNKLFEYAFSGLPVLASDFPEIGKVVRQYSLGFCSAVDLDSMKKMISNIVDGSVPIASGDFSELGWEAQAVRLNEAYDRLLEL
ncbi:glycosyltransferase [Alcaligenaceae bacterium CGII-47]|nr:glycosyltransferase [Alcaligenaceae bacterium CGII-47]